jgi:cytochrome P450
MAEPPGPRGSPLAALRSLRRDPIAFLARVSAYGDVAHVRLPRTSLYVLNHPDLVHLVLVERHHDVRKGPTMDAARRMLGESVLTSNGAAHLERRRLLQPIFHHARIETYGEVMVDRATRAAATWRDGQRLDVHAEMARLTLAIVARTLFGVDLEDARAREIGAALTEVLAQYDRAFSPWLRVTERLPLPANRRFERARAVFDGTVYGLIRERRAAAEPGDDLLSLLLTAEEDGVRLSDEQVRDEAITLFLAGHETTANALTWAWYLLGGHPGAAATLRAELDAALGGGPPSVADVPRLPYAGAAIREAMRRYPPAWAIGRRVVGDLEAGGYALPAGSVLVVSPWLLHHDPRWWPEPEAFRPERWLMEDPSRPRLAYLPFGAGPRMCIGEGFATLEAVLVLATIARTWSFERDPSHHVELQPVVTLRPRGGLPMVAHRRDVSATPGRTARPR